MPRLKWRSLDFLNMSRTLKKEPPHDRGWLVHLFWWNLSLNLTNLCKNLCSFGPDLSFYPPVLLHSRCLFPLLQSSGSSSLGRILVFAYLLLSKVLLCRLWSFRAECKWEVSPNASALIHIKDIRGEQRSNQQNRLEYICSSAIISAPIWYPFIIFLLHLFETLLVGRVFRWEMSCVKGCVFDVLAHVMELPASLCVKL